MGQRRSRCHADLHRGAGVGVSVALFALVAAACKGSASAPPAAAAAARAPIVRTAGAAVQIVDGVSPGAVSVAVSQALFASAPAAVVAPASDPAAVTAAAAQARRLGVPLLLQDAPSGVSGGARPWPADLALISELHRLGAAQTLTVGAAPAGLPGRITTRPGDVPAIPRAAPAAVSVLVHAGDGQAQVAADAVIATARAAGATVVPVHGDDPRADPAAIAALAGAPRRVLAAGAGFGPVDRLQARVAVARRGQQLPGGGQTLFPGRRFVALYGTPSTPSLGVLGEQGSAETITRAQRVAEPYRALGGAPVVPALEIIATVASGTPGRDGNYSTELAEASLRPLVERAGAAGMYVVLDLQPGRADFLRQAQQYAPLLQLPYVGLALDAEWRLTPQQQPLQQIGSVGVDEVNRVVTWLADLARDAALPQKLLVLHQFRVSMIRDERRLDTSRDELVPLVHMDGQGAAGVKDGTWAAITAAAPPGVAFGWKNFYDEDTPTLTPEQTMAHRPTPDMISYQ